MPLELSFPNAKPAEVSALVAELRRELLRRGISSDDIEGVRGNREHMDIVNALGIAGAAVSGLANIHGTLSFAQYLVDLSKRKKTTVKLESKEANLSITTNGGVAALQAKLEWIAMQESRTIGVILLGSSEFPYKPGLDKDSFLTSKQRVARVLTKEYLLAKKVAKLDLFGTDDLTHAIVTKIKKFLRNHKNLTDIIIYYCGHGGFLDNRKYYLTLRGTEEGQEATTGLLFDNFAHDLESALSGKRTYIILDCCFAGAASEVWMTKGVPAFVAEQIQQNYAPRGTALFVAASASEPALAPDEQDTTLFSGHFIKALREGIRSKATALSLVDLADHIRSRIENEPMKRRVKPEIHVPRKEDGDVSRSPLFRNPLGTDEPTPPEPPKPPQNWWQQFLKEAAPLATMVLALFAVALPVAIMVSGNQTPTSPEPSNKGPVLTGAPQSPASDLETRAREFLKNHFVQLQGDAKAVAAYARNIYQQIVVYQDKDATPREHVIKVLSDHVSQYPRRSYGIESENAKCERDRCTLTGQISYHQERPNDPVKYLGASAFTLEVVVDGNGFKIAQDKSTSVRREYTYSCSPTQVVTSFPGSLGGPMVATEIRPISALAASLRVIAVSPDRKSFATATDDNRIRLWDTEKFTLNKTFVEPHPGLSKLAFSASGKLLASVGSDDTVRVWDVAEGLVLHRVKEPNAHSVAFSTEMNNPYLLVGREDGSIPIRDKQFLVATRRLDENTPVRALSFLPNPSGTFVAAGSQSFVRYALGEPPARIVTNIGEIRQLAYSPNGQKILATGSDGKVKIWNAGALNEPPIEAMLVTQDSLAAWSADSKQVATAGSDRRIMLWDAATLGQPRLIGIHKEPIVGVVFHTNGRHLLSASRDGTIKVWDLKSRLQRELLTLMPMTDGGYLAYTPDNCYFGSVDVDNLFKVSVEGTEKQISEEQKKFLLMRDGFVLPPAR